jgi:hypothetical protein
MSRSSIKEVITGTRPSDKLTDEDIRNIKAHGSGCWTFIITVLWSVLVTLWLLDNTGFLKSIQ